MKEETPVEPDRLPGAPHPRETMDLFGQEAAEATFRAAAESGRLHHAWLITGPRGVGKATLAWRIARWLLAEPKERGSANDPASLVFRQTQALSHPALFLCRRPWDDKGERLRAEIPVDTIRGLKSFFQLASADGGRRVAIIDAADEMNVSAANALLKLLEEPPRGGTLLLVSHQPARLLPTIRSRCRELRCRPLGAEMLARALAAAGAPEPPGRVPLAELVGGSAGRAFTLLSEGGLGDYETVAALLAEAPPIDRRRIHDLADAAAARGPTSRLGPILDTVELALSRLARAGAGATVTPVSDAEARALSRLASQPVQGRLWAEAAARFSARTGHARAVHLDPAQVILDIFLQIDATAGEAIRAAA